MTNERSDERRMDEDKNVFLTIMHNDREDDDELNIDMGVIAKYARRLLAVWLCLALGLGCVLGASGLLLQKVLDESVTKALISFPNTTYNITKITSPTVMGDALNEMGLDILDMEDFRDAVEIGGLIPTSSYERLSMYYDLLKNDTGLASPDIIQSLLGADYAVSQYVVSFHYPTVGLSQKEGLVFLNALLRAYQDYCAKVYHTNLSMGNPLIAIDFHEYDYAEAANIFADTLNNADSYLASLNGEAGSFRSTETGLTFQDLRNTASLLKNIDLDRVSSYIVIHSVSDNDAETEIAYYKWRIESIEQQRNIQKTRYYSLEDSIDNYRKDDIIIINGVNGNSVLSNPADVNANYDTMIQEKLDAEAAIASYTRSISYFEQVIQGFQEAEANSDPKDIAFVREALENLNEKLNELILDINLTANEYYETLAFSDEVRILIPSTLDKQPLITSTTLKIVLIPEAILFVGYLCVVCLKGIHEANPPKKEEQPEKPQPVTATTV